MAYSPTVWTDRAVSTPNTYTKSGETSSEVTLVAKPGTVTQAGTAINASNMNKIETGLVSAAATADAALPKAGGAVSGNITYQGEVLPRTRKNATTGVFEYYDGTGWMPVGGALYKASDTVQFSDATERLTAGTGQLKLLAKFYAAYPGEIKITFDFKPVTVNAAPTSGVYAIKSTGQMVKGGSTTQFYPNAQVISSFVKNGNSGGLPLDTLTPVGTEFSDSFVIADGVANINDNSAVGPNYYDSAQLTYSTSWGIGYSSFSAVLHILEPGPIFLCLRGRAGGTNGNGAGAGAGVKNLAVKYDITGGGVS